MGFLQKVGAITLVVIVVIAGTGAAFFAGVLGTPSAGLEDRGDWGSVSEERTEVVTTVWVDNPNPIGVSVSDSVELSYQLSLNDVDIATGKKSGISVPTGNDTISVSTYIRNQELQRWWVAFVRNNETIPIRVDASANVGGTVSASIDLPTQEETILAEQTPIITSLSEYASGTEGTYTENLSQDRAADRLGIERSTLLSGGYVTDRDSEVTVGYEIREGWAEWGEVTDETTTVRFHFRIHNPGDVPVPAAPSNLGVNVEMNDVEMFSAQADDTSLQNPGDFSEGQLIGGRVLGQGETEEAVYAVEMDNENVDDWFRSHVRRGERTDIRVEATLVFSLQDVEFVVPADSPIAYTCDLQTDILVDGRNTSTNCGQIESPDITDGAEDPSSDTDTSEDETEEGTGDETEEGTGDDGESRTESDVEPPTAVAGATPTSGEAPLEVEFDASGSSDPDGDIERYVWRFKDGSAPAEGEAVTHTFRTAGEYDVELVAFDSQGNRDSTTVTVTVERRIG